ncbi:histidine phosphatase family protein [Paenibacillus sp. UMB4589-SE434]|uniref:histidine phosphatase family protein n=1 Tax=Paenibacillus sp. UMB4589-SE434 TaxID=3046314 RepID=UPI00254CB333|nr:histidine phosphatase family protein [Paenibacillus sp. UMB4589-SE434]MDK8180569.1 histidine phosphatase family protein [Paenibacillus sp. UMB4589-SE434]
MKIGLMRHFKVDWTPANHWMTADEFDQWIVDYNHSNIIPDQTQVMDTDWNICLSSDLIRARDTANIVYSGDIQCLNLLREIDIAPILRLRVRLHTNIWLALGRLAWYFAHRSQLESRVQVTARAQHVIDLIESYQVDNVLVVSHGMFIKVLNKQLRVRGYEGPSVNVPRNGDLYTYEKL